jgi:hypothetical protein
MELTPIEQEVIVLKAAIESIGTMVNHELLRVSRGAHGDQAIFKTALHQKFFNIILVDFLSKSAEKVTGQKLSSLDALAQICEKPNFDRHNSVKSMRRAVSAFKKWLECEIKVKVWFPSLSINAKLRVQRQEFIKICGDMSKHNISRLHIRAHDLKSILFRNGIEVSDEEGLLLLDDFYEKFHVDIFSYHGSYLAEQLNNIRRGIHEYLQPECRRGSRRDTRNRISYSYPAEMNTDFVKHYYCALMNEVSVTPYVEKFKTVKVLRLRH